MGDRIREHDGGVATLSRDNADTGRIIKCTGLQQGKGSSPAIYALNMEALIWCGFGETAVDAMELLVIGTNYIAPFSWADDHMLLASSAEELRHMFGILDKLVSAHGFDALERLRQRRIRTHRPGSSAEHSILASPSSRSLRTVGSTPWAFGPLVRKSRGSPGCAPAPAARTAGGSGRLPSGARTKAPQTATPTRAGARDEEPPTAPVDQAATTPTHANEDIHEDFEYHRACGGSAEAGPTAPCLCEHWAHEFVQRRRRLFARVMAWNVRAALRGVRATTQR